MPITFRQGVERVQQALVWLDNIPENRTPSPEAENDAAHNAYDPNHERPESTGSGSQYYGNVDQPSVYQNTSETGGSYDGGDVSQHRRHKGRGPQRVKPLPPPSTTPYNPKARLNQNNDEYLQHITPPSNSHHPGQYQNPDPYTHHPGQYPSQQPSQQHGQQHSQPPQPSYPSGGGNQYYNTPSNNEPSTGVPQQHPPGPSQYPSDPQQFASVSPHYNPDPNQYRPDPTQYPVGQQQQYQQPTEGQNQYPQYPNYGGTHTVDPSSYSGPPPASSYNNTTGQSYDQGPSVEGQSHRFQQQSGTGWPPPGGYAGDNNGYSTSRPRNTRTERGNSENFSYPHDTERPLFPLRKSYTEATPRGFDPASRDDVTHSWAADQARASRNLNQLFSSQRSINSYYSNSSYDTQPEGGRWP